MKIVIINDSIKDKISNLLNRDIKENEFETTPEEVDKIVENFDSYILQMNFPEGILYTFGDNLEEMYEGLFSGVYFKNFKEVEDFITFERFNYPIPFNHQVFKGEFLSIINKCKFECKKINNFNKMDLFLRDEIKKYVNDNEDKYHIKIIC